MLRICAKIEIISILGGFEKSFESLTKFWKILHLDFEFY